MSSRGEKYDNSVANPRAHNLLFSLRDKRIKKILMAMLVLISSLFVSNLIYAFLLADTFVRELSSNLGITLFVSLAIIPNGAGYYVLRRFIAPVHKAQMASNASSSSFFRLTYNLLKLRSFLMLCFLVLSLFKL